MMKLIKRSKVSHKGDSGRVLIIGGSARYAGAPILSAQAALSSGCDLSILFVPEKVEERLLDPTLICHPIQGDHFTQRHVEMACSLANDADAVVIGPGMTTEKGVRDFVRACVARITVPLVIDADALNVLDQTTLKHIHHCVFTPHQGEFERLWKKQSDAEQVKSLASESQIILLKGKTDLCSDGTQLRKNVTGNAGLTVGGTGDLLAGIVASFIAQGNGLLTSAYAGATILGICSDELYATHGFNYTPNHLLEILPQVVKRYNS